MVIETQGRPPNSLLLILGSWRARYKRMCAERNCRVKIRSCTRMELDGSERWFTLDGCCVAGGQDDAARILEVRAAAFPRGNRHTFRAFCDLWRRGVVEAIPRAGRAVDRGNGAGLRGADGVLFGFVVSQRATRSLVGCGIRRPGRQKINC